MTLSGVNFSNRHIPCGVCVELLPVINVSARHGPDVVLMLSKCLVMCGQPTVVSVVPKSPRQRRDAGLPADKSIVALVPVRVVVTVLKRLNQA